jgi:hypothetical protein
VLASFQKPAGDSSDFRFLKTATALRHESGWKYLKAIFWFWDSPQAG